MPLPSHSSRPLAVVRWATLGARMGHRVPHTPLQGPDVTPAQGHNPVSPGSAPRDGDERHGRTPRDRGAHKPQLTGSLSSSPSAPGLLHTPAEAATLQTPWGSSTSNPQ